MDFIILIASAFGGGLFGALVGALPAFIMVGIIGLAGLTAGAGAVDLVGNVAFGSFFGPHIAFAGGVAATAYAHNKNKIESGGNILLPMAKLNDHMTLIVGGIFGVLGFLINHIYNIVLEIPTDTIAMTVFTSGMIARILFGKTGLLGKKCTDGNRVFVPTKESGVFLITMGLGAGIISSYYAVTTGLVVLGFLVSATTLIFTQMGHPVPGTHHITLVSASAAVASGSILIGALFGILSALLGDLIGNIFNSFCDSHIDPPAGTIFLLSFVIFVFL